MDVYVLQEFDADNDRWVVSGVFADLDRALAAVPGAEWDHVDKDEWDAEGAEITRFSV